MEPHNKYRLCAPSGPDAKTAAWFLRRSGKRYETSRYQADLRHVGLDDTRQGVLVGNGLGGIAQRGGPLHQLVGVGGAAQEAVAAEAVEFGVA